VRKQATTGAVELAGVESAPIADLVELALTDSDNTIAEVLARLVARAAGRPASFADAGPAVLDALGRLGVGTAGAKLAGGSGLADGSRLSAQTLTAILSLAAKGGNAKLDSLLSGLPVAGASGTLGDRYQTGPSSFGRGVVRAKTGTLTGVTSLAGFVLDQSGRLLVFAFLADATGPTGPARAALDTAASTLAGCGCQ
jgi:D-alanyl-D-alanine carboxypeptidase/D-alanyl-D-alanine-endopeptidase (penicillin-binding protein 4)